MLSPAMATMLAVLTTDAAVDPSTLRTMLTRAVADSFNSLIVDDCTSTNDTVLLLANGALGNQPITRSSRAYEAFGDGLVAACADLARQMAADAEGATKLATIVVRGARSEAEARTAARAVARSQLVQCSLYGNDPYWGRVLSELGASGARFNPERVEVSVPGRARLSRRHRRAPRRSRAGAVDARARRCDRLRPARRHRRGHRDLHRPDPRVCGREHGHVVSERAQSSAPSSSWGRATSHWPHTRERRHAQSCRFG